MTTCIAMCVYQQVHPITAACVNSVLELPNFGMAMVRGCPNIDIARAMVVKKALDNPRVTRILFIDSDIAFGVEQIAKLLSHPEPIVGLPYCNRHTGEPAVQLLTGEEYKSGIQFGPGPRPLLPVRGLGTGCLVIHRQVFETMTPNFPPDYLGLREWFSCGIFFDEALKDRAYYSDDYAFCARARQYGFPIYCDTTEPVLHYDSRSGAWLNVFGKPHPAPEITR